MTFCDLWYMKFGGSRNLSLYFKLYIAIHMHLSIDKHCAAVEVFLHLSHYPLLGARGTSDGCNLTQMTC